MFTDAGVSEATKGAVHGALLTIAAACAIYNGCAYTSRNERHLKVNTLVYVGLILFEIWQVKQHCDSCAGGKV